MIAAPDGNATPEFEMRRESARDRPRRCDSRRRCRARPCGPTSAGRECCQRGSPAEPAHDAQREFPPADEPAAPVLRTTRTQIRDAIQSAEVRDDPVEVPSGSRSFSMAMCCASTPRACAICTMPGAASMASTSTPRDIRCTASSPVPQPRSRIRSPGRNRPSTSRHTCSRCARPRGVSDQSAAY